MTEPIEYKSVIAAGGQSLLCVESYDSLFERIREGSLKMMYPENEEEPSGSMQWFPPLEVTVKPNDDGPPIRVLVSLQAISAIFEIPERQRQKVEEELAL